VLTVDCQIYDFVGGLKPIYSDARALGNAVLSAIDTEIIINSEFRILNSDS
jgi:hypothetical protein